MSKNSWIIKVKAKYCKNRFMTNPYPEYAEHTFDLSNEDSEDLIDCTKIYIKEYDTCDFIYDIDTYKKGCHYSNITPPHKKY